MKVVTTPGYMAELEKDPIRAAVAQRVALGLVHGHSKPDMVVVDPAVADGETIYEDDGRTAKIHGPFRTYAIRSDHENDCDCGCGGGSYITLLLPEEY